MEASARTLFTSLSLIVATLGASGTASAAHRHEHFLKNVSATTDTASTHAGATRALSPAGSHEARHWLDGKLPPGGAIGEGGVVHTVRPGESWATIADAYLDLTGIYDVTELAKAIAKTNPSAKPTAGTKVTIPSVLPNAPKSARLGLPKDDDLRGVYVRGSTAGGAGYVPMLEHVAAHGLNAIVLDVKDYDGPLTYPSKVAFAVDDGADDKPPMRSYARAVRFAHERGIRVIARVSCFNDQLTAKAHPGLAIRGVSGHPYRNGWVDPQNETHQAYIADLVKEALAANVDEIQLDYVRFPVIGMKNIDFKLDLKQNPRAKVDVITAFVEKIHKITKAHDVPLALDVFGVIAFGKDADIQNLGQDPAELSKHAEFLNPMVYPSHYDAGFMGMDAPGEHPELVGLGVKHMREYVAEKAGDKAIAKIRPWLQAMSFNSANYGPAYIQEEIRTGDKAGASGYLLWNPGQTYDVAWRAIPRKVVASEEKHASVTKHALTRASHRHE